MREILFKAKRIDNDEWIEGNVIYDRVTGQCFMHRNGNGINESHKVNEEECFRFFAYKIDPKTVCQYIGLRDKCARKIYENDFIKRQINDDDEIIGVFTWKNIGQTGFSLMVGVGDLYHYYPISCGEWDDDEGEVCRDIILGNIFD